MLHNQTGFKPFLHFKFIFILINDNEFNQINTIENKIKLLKYIFLVYLLFKFKERYINCMLRVWDKKPRVALQYGKPDDSFK